VRKLLLLLLLLGTPVHAGEWVVAEWTMASKYTSGAPLSLSSIRATSLRWRRCGTTDAYLTQLVLAPATRKGLWLKPGTWCLSARTVLYNGSLSVWTPNVRRVAT
jgi:hypothetical protein